MFGGRHPKAPVFDEVGMRLKNKVLNNLADHCPMKKTMTMRYPMTGICIHIQYICVYMCQGVAVQAGP